MTKRPRTSADFNEWFKGGGPWNYRDVRVQRRLRHTARFLQRHLGEGFSGNFLEAGAYDGSFTCLLGALFPAARIVVNDISDVAIGRARTAVSCLPGPVASMDFVVKDLLLLTHADFTVGFFHREKPTVILLLECLYYLKEDEREEALTNLFSLFPQAPLAISTPIIGGVYFTEAGLMALLQRHGYEVRALKTMNLRRGDRVPGMRLLSDRMTGIRRLLANQVLYYFHFRNPIDK